MYRKYKKASQNYSAHRASFSLKNIAPTKHVRRKDNIFEPQLKVLTNEKRGGLKVVAFDRSPRDCLMR
jgi:hypothetical protein